MILRNFNGFFILFCNSRKYEKLTNDLWAEKWHKIVITWKYIVSIIEADNYSNNFSKIDIRSSTLKVENTNEYDLSNTF